MLLWSKNSEKSLLEGNHFRPLSTILYKFFFLLRSAYLTFPEERGNIKLSFFLVYDRKDSLHKFTK